MKEQNQRLLQTFERTPEALSREQLVTVSGLYHELADRAVNKDYRKASRRRQLVALLNLDEVAVTEAAYLWAEANSHVKSYQLLSLSAKAMAMAGHEERAQDYYRNAATLAETATRKLEGYSFQVKDPDEKLRANKRMAGILYDASRFALRAGDEPEHRRLIFKQRMVINDNRRLELETAMRRLPAPIDTARLDELRDSIARVKRERSAILSGV
jgi:hypothetical protein